MLRGNFKIQVTSNWILLDGMDVPADHGLHWFDL
jgi:hypothetical protein